MPPKIAISLARTGRPTKQCVRNGPRRADCGNGQNGSLGRLAYAHLYTGGVLRHVQRRQALPHALRLNFGEFLLLLQRQILTRDARDSIQKVLIPGRLLRRCAFWKVSDSHRITVAIKEWRLSLARQRSKANSSSNRRPPSMQSRNLAECKRPMSSGLAGRSAK